MKGLLIAAATICIAASTASAELIKGSREYTRLKKEVQADKKQLLVDRQEVAEFSSLLREMEATDPQETSRYYWNLSAQVRRAMEREFEQTLDIAASSQPAPPTQSAATLSTMQALDEPAPATGNSVSGQRAERMKMIVAEAKGLQHALANGESDARGRYHHLLAEFLGIMRAEVEDASDGIAVKEEQLK